MNFPILLDALGILAALAFPVGFFLFARFTRARRPTGVVYAIGLFCIACLGFWGARHESALGAQHLLTDDDSVALFGVAVVYIVGAGGYLFFGLGMLIAAALSLAASRR